MHGQLLAGLIDTNATNSHVDQLGLIAGAIRMQDLEDKPNLVDGRFGPSGWMVGGI